MAITARFSSGWRACCQERRLLKLSTNSVLLSGYLVSSKDHVIIIGPVLQSHDSLFDTRSIHFSSFRCIILHNDELYDQIFILHIGYPCFV